MTDKGSKGRTGWLRRALLPTLAVCLTAACAAAAGAPEVAKASFPGQNGAIVFEAHGSYSGGVGLDVFATDANGAGPTNLTRDLPPASEERSPAFSADGKRITFASDKDHLGEGDRVRASDLYAMNADGTGKVRLTSDGSASPYGKPAFSPDGRRVFYTGRDGGLYSVGADGTAKAKLATTTASWGDVDVAPNGALVAFVGNAGSATGNDGTVYVARPDGTGQRILTQGAGEEDTPRFMPDGRIAFSRALPYNATAPDPARFVVNADGTGERRLSGGLGSISPSPDGTSAAYKAPAGLYVSALDGSNARLIGPDSEGAGEISFVNAPDWGAKPAATPPPPPPNTAPTITYPRPVPGSTTYDLTPLIGATVKDKETDLQKSNIALYVDGARIGTSYFSYDRASDRLSYQRTSNFGRSGHTVKIVATDAKGLAKTYSWPFYVK